MKAEIRLSETQQSVFERNIEWAKAYGRSLAKRAGLAAEIAENAALVGLATTCSSETTSDNIRCVSKLNIFGEVLNAARREGQFSHHRLRRQRGKENQQTFVPYEPHKDRRTCNQKTPDEQAIFNEDVASIPARLDALPAELRDIIERRYFNDESAEEIAKATGVTPRCVDLRHNRALELMRGAA